MSDDHSKTSINEEKEAFKQAKVFTQSDECFGIPSKIFYNTVGICIGLVLAFRSTYGAVVAIIMFVLLIVPLYQIHRKDPFALVVWVKCLLRRHDRWCAGRSSKRVVNILTKEEF